MCYVEISFGTSTTKNVLSSVVGTSRIYLFLFIFSRSAECAKLLKVSSLQIWGSIGTKALCAALCNAYLVYKQAPNVAYGLYELVAKISIGGTVVSAHAACLESLSSARRCGVIYPVTRADGWMELKLGENVNRSGEHKELTAMIHNTDGSWNKGLIIQCMEIRRVDCKY